MLTVRVPLTVTGDVTLPVTVTVTVSWGSMRLALWSCWVRERCPLQTGSETGNGRRSLAERGDRGGRRGRGSR